MCRMAAGYGAAQMPGINACRAAVGTAGRHVHMQQRGGPYADLTYDRRWVRRSGPLPRAALCAGACFRSLCQRAAWCRPRL